MPVHALHACAALSMPVHALSMLSMLSMAVHVPSMACAAALQPGETQPILICCHN
jgi:hypothetical protein